MTSIVQITKLIEIYISCDDFVKEMKQQQEQSSFGSVPRKPTRITHLTESEMMCILIFYHLSGYKCFEYYYKKIILGVLRSYFPKAVCYERFVALAPRTMPLMFVYLNCYRTGKATGIYYADSKKLPVCDNTRIHQHKVFSNKADRGKSSTGWFYGFKIFLVVNQYGELIKGLPTKASKADNNFEWMLHFFENLKGKVFTDKGFLSSKAFEKLMSEGLKIVTGIRTNMKNKLMDMTEKLLLKKRGMIESVNDILMTVCDIDHTRHRSVFNFFVNLFSGLSAYTFLDKIPSFFNKKYAIE
jgi:hypothetical protein